MNVVDSYHTATDSDINSMMDDQQFPRKLQQEEEEEDAIVDDQGCYIQGDYTICPTQADFELMGVVTRLQADLICPLEAVGQFDFANATQQGLCDCDATLVELSDDGTVNGTTAESLDCHCFVCPDDPNNFGVAYGCNAPFIGPCSSFNCLGQCNGLLEFTKAPSVAPSDVPSISPTTPAPVTPAPTFSNPTGGDGGDNVDNLEGAASGGVRFHAHGMNMDGAMFLLPLIVVILVSMVRRI